MNIQHNTAKLAKEKGFDIPIWSFYGHDKKLRRFNQICNFNGFKHGVNKASISSPTQSELQKWLREVHNTHIKVYLNEFNLYTTYSYSILYNKKNGYFSSKLTDEIFDTYEEALETGLFAALNLI